MYSNASRLEILIGDVLDVQKLAMGQMKFAKTKVNLKEFFTSIYEDSKVLMTPKHIQFIVPSVNDLAIISDEDRLRQVFDNLIRNAVDFVPDSNGIIEIEMKAKNDEILFVVKDNGIGIPKEKQQHLFKKFYQIDTTRTRKHGGTGLGLVICKGIIEGLGGTIGVESNGQGTSFHFTLPKT